jgi:hypothetical protein
MPMNSRSMFARLGHPLAGDHSTRSNDDDRKERRMTLLPRAPIDLLLAPVAVHLDMNVARLRDMSPAEIDFQVALELDRPERTGTAEERMERFLAVAVRNVELHGWTPTITDDHCRMRLSGGSVSIDLGLSAQITRFIDGVH